jgi:hypothetical protein
VPGAPIDDKILVSPLTRVGVNIKRSLTKYQQLILKAR